MSNQDFLSEEVSVVIKMKRSDLNKLTFIWSSQSYSDAVQICANSSIKNHRFGDAYNGEIPFSEMPSESIDG